MRLVFRSRLQTPGKGKDGTMSESSVWDVNIEGRVVAVLGSSESERHDGWGSSSSQTLQSYDPKGAFEQF